MNICVAILAAGESKRLGQAKQWIEFRGKSLIEHTVDMVLELDVQQRVMITGGLHDELVERFKSKDIELVFNENFKDGMQTSFEKAIEIVSEKDDMDAVLIVLCDQPLIPITHYQKMIEKAKIITHNIVSTTFGSTFGAPSLFKRPLFDKIKSLPEGKGAKAMIKSNIGDASFLKCKEAAFDVDTEKDLEQLRTYN